MVLPLSLRWNAHLREKSESGMTYQMVTITLRDGRRFERVPCCTGYLDLTGLPGFWKVPIVESDIIDIVVTDDRSGPPRLVTVERDRDSCPFAVGDSVVFSPSARTRGLYQDIERFGVVPGEILVITEIRDGTYLYFAGGVGGWPWNEFSHPNGS